MTSVFCEQCRAPVSDAAKFCLRCGSRTGRRPNRAFKVLSLLFFVLAGAMISGLLLVRLAPRTASRTSVGLPGIASNTAQAGLDRDATVLADSFCSESDTQIMQLYALLAQGDRNGAAALVLCESTLPVRAGTVVHEDKRTGRLSHIRIVSGDATSKACWIPTILLSRTDHRAAVQPHVQAPVNSSRLPAN